VKSLVAATFCHGGSAASRRPLVRLLGIAPAALLLSGLFTVWGGPLAAPVAAAAPTGVVVGWGDNSYGQTDVPAGLSGVTAIAAGTYHSLALKSDGTVVASGSNGSGESNVPAGLSGITAIAGGEYFSLALKSDGTIVAWGDDRFGETTVPAGLSGVTAIAAGQDYSLALKSDSTVVAWGYNAFGQTDVPAGLSGVTAIAAGSYFSLALKSDGTVVAWGSNFFGETPVPAGLSGITAIDAGGYHSLALKSDGTVVAWGRDDDGESNVPAGLSGVTAIAAGQGFSLALKSNGTVVAWGWNRDGETTVPAGLSGVTAIAAGDNYSLALVPSAAATLTVSGIPSPYVVGDAHDVTVTAKGPDGNVATGYRGKVHFTSSDAAATLPADYTFTAADAGVHTFSHTVNPALVLRTAGSQSVTATDKLARSITGAQSGITVVGQTLAVSGIANPYVAGDAHSVTVTAKEADGNTDAGYRGTIHFASSDPAASLPADYTFTPADGGIHKFLLGLVLRTAGSQSVTATDKLATSITGAQSGITVISQTLAVFGIANPYVAGVAHNVTVAAKEASGNTNTGYRGTIHFSSTDPAAVLPADYTFTAADAGVHQFSLGLTLETVGSQGVRARDTGTSSITGAKYGIIVTGYPAATVTVSGSPIAGVAHDFTVTAKDANGHTDAGYRGTMHFTSTDPKAVLPANYKFTAADSGVHTFSVTFKTSDAQGIRARDTVTSTMTGAKYDIVVTAAAATRLVVVGLSSPRTAGVAGTITVSARDVYGNVATGYRGTVHFTSTDYAASRGFYPGFLPADYTFTAASAGKHTFSIDLVAVGTQAVRARDTVTSTITGLESGIVVT